MTLDLWNFRFGAEGKRVSGHPVQVRAIFHNIVGVGIRPLRTDIPKKIYRYPKF